MTLEPKEILIEFIFQLQTISPEAKAIMIEQIETENLDEDFEDIFNDIVDQEIANAEAEIEALDEEVSRLETKELEEKKRVLPMLKKVKDEYIIITQKMMMEFENLADQRERNASQKIESEIHTNIEQSEIDSIHSFLNKPKSDS
jgi:hypothetical protein